MLQRIRENMEQAIIGKPDTVDLVLTALVCRGHVLIEDVHGVGKTTLVASLARSLDCSFKRIQFTPDVLPSDVTGYNQYDLQTGPPRFVPGAVMSQIILADEINRCSPKTQSALLEVMAESQVTVDGVTYPLPQPFMVLATQNPVEFVGTFPLPEAQVDRFLLRISMGYPSHEDGVKILQKHLTGSQPVAALEPVASATDVTDLQKAADAITCAKPVMEYVTRIVEATRTHDDIVLGVSPRGAISLTRAAQGWALLRGAGFVTPDDVQKMAVPALAHRIVLRPQAAVSRDSAADLVTRIVRQIPVPAFA
ncbi:MAG: MoxR family ATPase [Clostridiaceae bacterium]|nr:MoxR family ATPase [Clostridiaceae bacterium]